MSKTLAPSRTVTARDPKGLKFISIVEAAYNKAGLSPEEAQRVNDTPGLSELVANFIAENRSTGKFKNEEVKSGYTYPKKYTGPKPIDEQIETLAKIFNLDPTTALEFTQNLPPLPEGAEGYFAIPKWEKIASTYSEAVEKVLELIASSRQFCNYRQGEVIADRLRVHAHTAQALEQIAEQQKGDILIVPGQFGLRHRGRSVRRAREVYAVGEFGFGAFAVGCMLLTHPERLGTSEELWIDCGGDKFAPVADGRFSGVPYFVFDSGEVGFDAGGVDGAGGRCGSASGFSPQ